MKSKWGIRKLGDLCNISSSKRIFAREYCSKGVPFYRGKEIIEMPFLQNYLFLRSVMRKLRRKMMFLE